jgi:hypothetical protein
MLVGFLEARKRRGARKKGHGDPTGVTEPHSTGVSNNLYAPPPASGPILEKPSSDCHEIDSRKWTAPAISYPEPPPLQRPYQQNSSVVELGSNPASPMIPELSSYPETPQLHAQAASLSPISTMSDLANHLSPTYNSSFFPSAPPTPFFPPAQPSSSGGEGRQRTLSVVSSITELSSNTERTMTSTPNYPPSNYPLSNNPPSNYPPSNHPPSSYPPYSYPPSQPASTYGTRQSSVSSGLIPDPAANAPEVAYATPPLPPRPPKMSYNTRQDPHERRINSYDSSLPEVVPSSHFADLTRYSSLPEVVHEHLSPPNSGNKLNAEQGSLQRSATQEQRDRRRARLNLISEG